MSQDVEQWKRELAEAGWTAASATAWWDPTGGLYRGPYGAWKELQRRKGDETVSHDTQVKQEDDKALALNIAEAFFNNRLPIIDGKPFASVHSNPTLNLADKIEAALATVRREEREAAFKILCPDCAEGDTPTYDSRARWHYHRWGSDEVFGCSASKLRMAVEGQEENSREHIS